MNDFVFDGLDVFLENTGVVSKFGWKARFDREPEVQCKPFNIPRLSQLSQFVPMSFRYAFRFYLRKRLVERRLPFLDPTRHVPWRPIYGVPAGGIGCGAIGRGFRGEFVRSSLIPGMYSYETQPADQFIVTIRRKGTTVYQRVLSPHKSVPSSAHCLRNWTWGFPSQHGRYVGLYPRSWTIYELPYQKLVLVCQQISPVLPHDYKDSCLPCCVFLWKIFNFDSEPLDVSISFSWHGPTPLARVPDNHSVQNGDAATGDSKVAARPQQLHTLTQTNSFTLEQSAIRGCTLNRLIGNELPCCFAIAAKCSKQVSVSTCPGFLFERFRSGSTSKSPGDLSPLENDQFDIKTSPQIRSFERAPDAKMIWDQLYSSEGLEDIDGAGYEVPYSQSLRRLPPKLAVMVSASCTVPPMSNSQPGQTELEFALTWHSPEVRFRGQQVVYKRRYARWFPEPGDLGAQKLVDYALANWRQWIERIEQWQNPVLNDNTLPDWYKSALFNELYYMTDGGTVWLDPVHVKCCPSRGNEPRDYIPIDLVRIDKPSSKLDPSHLTGRHLIGQDVGEQERWKQQAWEARSALGREMGLFAYLEGHEYRMFNTVDVHFYSSWAFIKLWPKLQLALNLDCADLTIEADHTETYFIHEGCYGVRHVEASVPHDFGDPENEPWRDANAYIMFPTNQWKDLSPKFILQVWRDWKVTGDDKYLLYMLPIVCRLIRICLNLWDNNNDGMIENSGFPDQTFDTWKANGISAYTGGLWLGCLYAAQSLLERVLAEDFPFDHNSITSLDVQFASVADLKTEYQSLLKRAKEAYTQALWTGSHYAYQSSPLGNYQSIMAAQLCGHWFVRVAGAPAEAILPQSQVLVALNTIQNANWLSVKNGTVGAINGILPSLKLDTSNVQAEEFWVGINYALAATLVMENMKEDGLSLARSCYNTVYNTFGLQYQTPEAYMLDGRFRCTGYMRPMAIWSIQHALELTRGAHTPERKDVLSN